MVIEMKTNKKISIIRNVLFTLLVVGCCVGVTSYAITFYNDRNHSDLGGDAEATDTNDSAEGMANGTADSTANGIVSGSGDNTANSNADDTVFSDGDGDGTANGSADATSDCDGNGAANGNSGGIANGGLNGDSDGASDTAETVPPDTDAVSKLPQTDGSSEISDTNPVISDTPRETSGTLNSEGANGNNGSYSFSDVLFIGDSRTVGLSEYGGTDAVFFADVGMSVFNLFQRKVYVPHVGKVTLEELLGRYEYSKIYIMLGINELGYNYNSIISKYTNIVETIKSMQKSAWLILEGNLHVTAERSAGDEVYNNSNIDSLNLGIKRIAEQTSAGYIDVNELFDDSQGCLDKKFTSDNTHLLGRYYRDWAKWIAEATKNL